MPRCGTSKGDDTMSRWQCPQGATMICTVLLVLAGCVSEQKYDALDTHAGT